MTYKFLFLNFLFLLFNCKSEPAKQLKEIIEGTTLNLRYAKGFSVKDYGTYKILEIKKPWPESEKEYHFALLKDNHDVDFWIKERQRFDNTIRLPIKKIVVTSTTHIPALELLDVEKTLIGFPGTDFISSKTIRQQIQKGSIRELGKGRQKEAEGDHLRVLSRLPVPRIPEVRNPHRHEIMESG